MALNVWIVLVNIWINKGKYMDHDSQAFKWQNSKQCHYLFINWNMTLLT